MSVIGKKAQEAVINLSRDEPFYMTASSIANSMGEKKQVTPKKRIVVVGAGIAGLWVAQKLAKHKDCAVTLISDKDYFLFLPRLTELFNNTIPAEKAVRQLTDVWKGELIIDKANLVNPEDKVVVLNSGKRISYEYCVIAVGSKTNFFNTPGNHNSYSFYSKEDADKLKEHVKNMVDADEQPGVHTFAIIGGGPTGVEVASVINRLARQRRQNAIVMIIERNPLILKALPPKLGFAAADALSKAGIVLRTNTSVASIAPMSINVQTGEKKESIPCYTTVWTAGSVPQTIAITGIEPTARGDIPVKQTLQLQTDENVFVIGDCAASSTPKTAQSALQQAHTATNNITALIEKKPLEPFAFNEKGTIIALEKNTVGLFYGKLLKGFLAQQARDKYYWLTMREYT